MFWKCYTVKQQLSCSKSSKIHSSAGHPWDVYTCIHCSARQCCTVANKTLHTPYSRFFGPKIGYYCSIAIPWLILVCLLWLFLQYHSDLTLWWLAVHEQNYSLISPLLAATLSHWETVGRPQSPSPKHCVTSHNSRTLCSDMLVTISNAIQIICEGCYSLKVSRVKPATKMRSGTASLESKALCLKKEA